MTDRTFKIMVAIPFALIPLALIGGKSASFERMVLKPAEIETLEYAGQENGATVDERGASASLRTAGFNPFLAVGDEPWQTGQGSQRKADDGQLRVTLTVLKAGGGVAVINDMVVREGDTIRGITVKSIKRDSVLLTNGKTLPVYPEGHK